MITDIISPHLTEKSHGIRHNAFSSLHRLPGHITTQKQILSSVYMALSKLALSSSQMFHVLVIFNWEEVMPSLHLKFLRVNHTFKHTHRIQKMYYGPTDCRPSTSIDVCALFPEKIYIRQSPLLGSARSTQWPLSNLK